jgi:hypothetical protein
VQAHEEVYIPRSSDEAFVNDEDGEGGFLMVSTAPSHARIPLHTNTSRGLDRMHIQVPDLDDPTSPMEISPSVGCFNGSVNTGYISSSSVSCASRPMSVVQDSPMLRTWSSTSR